MAIASNEQRSDIIDAAARQIMTREGADASRFVQALYQEGSAEDLAAYHADDLALCGLSAWHSFQQRKDGRHMLAIEHKALIGTGTQRAGHETPENGQSDHIASVTLINIANADMPFLLDSVMGELNAAGHEVRLVLHPIVAVERDRDGALTAFHGLKTGPTGMAESVIQIHIAAIDDPDLLNELTTRLDEILGEVQAVVRDWRPMKALLEETAKGYRTNPPAVSVEDLAEAVQFLEWLADNHFVLMGMRDYVYVGSKSDGHLERSEADGLGLLADPQMRVLRKGAAMVTTTPEVREFLLKPEPLIITKANLRSRVHRRAHLDYIGVKTYADDGSLKGELRLVGLFTSSAYAKSAAQIPILRRKIDKVLVAAGYDPASHSGKALINVLEFYPRDELFQLDDDTLLRNALTVLQLEERPRVRVLPRRDKFDRFVSVLVYTPRDHYSTDVRLKIGAYLAKAYDGYVSTWFIAYPEGTLARLHLIIGRRTGSTPKLASHALERAVEAIIRTWTDELASALSAKFALGLARDYLARYQDCFSAAYRENYSPAQGVADIDHIERLLGSSDTFVAFGQRADQDHDLCHLKFYQAGQPLPLSDRVPILEHMGFRVINERTYRLQPGRPLNEADRLDRAGLTNKGRSDSSFGGVSLGSDSIGGHDLAGDGAAQRDVVYLHDMTLQTLSGQALDLARQKAPLEAAFMAVWQGRAEDDGFNRLTLDAGIGWRDVALVRAYSRYLRQGQLPYSPDYVWEVVNRHSAVIGRWVDLFHQRFEPPRRQTRAAKKAQKSAARVGPDARDEAAQAGALAETAINQIEDLLASVTSLDDDVILRAFLTVLKATVRTNFFQLDSAGKPKTTFAFKLKPQEIAFLPQPRPFREIFVYAISVEGVHLRYGPVARGGLRWSDRAQDFRTEVLGLVKAQQVKNAVIVPVGAKGGFFPKKLPHGGTREAVFAAGTAAYKTFINALLDVTDNLVADDIIPPPGVISYDEDDPYLVVAADKGTATFSDTANEISQGRDFWLSDAFASGGSAGYDHKKMGITARGAWEAVKRHFREMDHDIQTQPFTVVGVGDMSGDVFGNGMLLSPAIRLIAAFDHRDIFIDPDPDTKTSFAERQRVFELGRSSWQDYNQTLISKGGGIFSRAAKSIELSAEIKALLNVTADHLAPNELLQAILKCPADLMWFGGIGTYIKASSESDAEVGDKANDALRISASEVGARVIGEGANLGITQLGRVEFCRHGGRCNSDAIDNSAGVNSSDVEVNIKIALGAAVRADKLTLAARNTLLADMTDPVAALVLANNYDQTLSISLSEQRGAEDFGYQRRLMQTLEGRGLLDRAVEKLPDEAALADREAEGRGLTRPEIGVLMAYAKLVLFDDLLAGDVVEDPYLRSELIAYFPQAMAEPFASEIDHHRLRREIIATRVVNDLINRGGATLGIRLQEGTGIDVDRLVRCFLVVRKIFRLQRLEAEIDSLDTAISGTVQLALYRALQDFLHDRLAWFARNADLSGGLADIIERYQPGTDQIAASLGSLLADWGGGRAAAEAATWQQEGVPAELATTLVLLPALADAPDIVMISAQTNRPLHEAESTFRYVGLAFKLSRLKNAARAIAIDDYFEGLALDRALQQIAAAQQRLTRVILTASGATKKGPTRKAAEKGDTGDRGDRGEQAFQRWSLENSAPLERTLSTIDAIVEGGTMTVAKLAVVAGLLSDLSQNAS